VKINSRGLRDREYTYEKPEKVYRILVLGDSFTQAIQVPLEATFHKQLETLLNQQNRVVSYEVINAGVGNWGTGQELLFFRHEGYKYSPNLVMLVFFVGNDVLDNSVTLSSAQLEHRPFFSYRYANNSLGPVMYADKTREENAISLTKAVLRNSRVYWLARNRLMRLPAVSKFLVEQGIMTNLSDSYSIHLSDYSPELEEGWAVTLALIKQLRDEVEAQDANLVVVIIPSIAQVDEDMWELVRDTYLPAGAEANPDKPDTILLNFLEEEGSSYLHLLPHFREQPTQLRERLYFRHDGHWDVAGHRLTAQLIYDHLTHEFWPSRAE
jgi:hypothetical protein